LKEPRTPAIDPMGSRGEALAPKKSVPGESLIFPARQVMRNEGKRPKENTPRTFLRTPVAERGEAWAART